MTGKRIAAEGVLHAMGRQGNTDTLNLDAVSVQADKRGLLEVNSFYQVRLCCGRGRTGNDST